MLAYVCDLPGKRKKDRSRDGFCTDPGSDGEHGSSSVLDFDQLTTVGDFNLERVVVQVVSSQSSGLKTWGDRFAFLDFSVTVSQFVDLNGSNHGEDLGKTFGRNGLDGFNRSHGSQVRELNVLCNRQVLMRGDLVEGDSQLLEGKSNGCKHGRASVLDFGCTKEVSGGLASKLGGELFVLSLSKVQVSTQERSSTERLFGIQGNIDTSIVGGGGGESLSKGEAGKESNGGLHGSKIEDTNFKVCLALQKGETKAKSKRYHSVQQMIETSLVAVERSRVQGVVVVDDNITTDHELLLLPGYFS